LQLVVVVVMVRLVHHHIALVAVAVQAVLDIVMHLLMVEQVQVNLQYNYI
jgi:hypothetical protein